jgi:hypothetical protein
MPEASSFYLSLVSFQPRLGWDQNVAVRPTLELRFSHALNLAQVQTDAELNQQIILTRMTDDQSVPVTYRDWDPVTRILSLAPSGDLVAGGLYQVTLRRTLTTSQGRGMLSDRQWSFQVSDAALGQVQLESPGDSTAYTTPPALAWTGVWFPSGSVTYQVQVDRDWGFGSSVLWSTAVTTSSSGGDQTAAIGTALDASQVYYWRVRAYTPMVTGTWSETRSFYLGTDTAASPDTVASYHPDRAFRLLELEPENGLTNRSDWPVLRATFSQPLSGSSVNTDTVQLVMTAVDGDVATAAAAISGQIALYTNRIEFTPSETILSNRRYVFTLTDGLRSTTNEALPEPVETYFTGPYAPLYGGTIAVRALLGGFVDDTSDDEILFHLWRGSLQANEQSRRVAQPNVQPTEADLIAYRPASLTWGIVRYAELTAAISLVRRQYYELLQRAGAKTQLGAFSYDLDVKVLAELRALLEDLDQQRATVAASYLLTGAYPATSITAAMDAFATGSAGRIGRIGLGGLSLVTTYRSSF